MEFIPVLGVLMPWMVLVGIEVVCSVPVLYGAIRLIDSGDKGARMIGWLVLLGLAVVGYFTYGYIAPFL